MRPASATLPICQWRWKPNQPLDAPGPTEQSRVAPPYPAADHLYAGATEAEEERRRGVWSVKGKRAADDADATEETGETSHAVPARGASPLPQHSIPVEATERRVHSTTGNLSEGTLKAMLEVQEQESAKGDGAPVVTKD
jgi:hypothetical protein